MALRADPMRQVDDILARFPGPVTLRISWQRKLAGLLTGLAFIAVFSWLFLSDYAQTRGYISGRSGVVAAWIVIAFFAVLAARAALLFLISDAGRLSLDADGFEIRHITRRVRRSWREVGAFGAETERLPSGVGGSSEWILYDVPIVRRASAGPEVPPVYGLPRDDLLDLLNRWRTRALDVQHARAAG